MLALTRTACAALLIGFASISAAEERRAVAAQKTLPTVRVEGQAAQPNETTLGKAGVSLREIPQSISVLTRQQLDEQNLTSLPEAMKYATGVTVQRFDGAGFFNTFLARGYPADSFLLDGLNLRTNGNMVDLDLAIFDRIEVLRGPAGLFQGTGQPGVTINLLRKRALAPFQVQTLAGAGSWNNYRGELDVTGAFTAEGGARGRLVTAYEDRDSHLNDVDAKKKLAYGTLELDLAERSTLSVGGTYQDVQGVTDQGLPAFADGRLLNVPRSTAIVADWNLQDMKTTEGFAELENRFDDGSFLKVAVRRQNRDMYYLSGRANGLTSDDGTLRVQYVDNLSEQTDTSTDAFFSMPFTLAGQTHNLLIGADYREGKTFSTHSDGVPTLSNVFSYDTHIARPPLVEAIAQRSRSRTEEYGVYSQLRARPADRLTVLLGGRVSWWDSIDRNAFTGLVTTRGEASSEFTPYAGLIFDLNSVLSLYASYTDIFKPQTERTFAGEQLKPRTGSQYETGIKGEFLDGRLNAHAAVFHLTDENRALGDVDNPGFSLPIGKVRSEGAETEISGLLRPNWSLVAGYAYNSTKYLKAAVSQQGQAFSTFTPKHSVDLWTHYVLEGGPVPGLELGAGARTVSEFYAAAGAVRFVADSYTIVSSQIGYTFAGRHRVALNVDNLLDEKYYEKVSGAARQNFYGAPRSFMLTVRSRF